MRLYLSLAEIRFMANLLTNMTAGLLGVAFVSPNFGNLSDVKNITLLTLDIGFAIPLSVFSIKLEEKLI